jgi:hypothetical protein
MLRLLADRRSSNRLDYTQSGRNFSFEGYGGRQVQFGFEYWQRRGILTTAR